MGSRTWRKASALIVGFALAFALVASAQNVSQTLPSSLKSDNEGSLIDNLFAAAVMAVVNGGVNFISVASPIICPLSVRQSGDNSTDEPTLYVFNDAQDVNRSVRIFPDDTITRELVDYAQFNRSQLTYIIIHGWLGGVATGDFLTSAKNLALGASAEGNCQPECSTANRPNVIVVDWNKLAFGSLYRAIANTPTVSSRLARMLSQLAQVGGLKPELMHCIGHSLGAHICGQAARQAFNGSTPSAEGSGAHTRMGRITGLDPGGFCYDLGFDDQNSYFGLKPSDALLVDTVNTNRAVFGTKLNNGQYGVRVNNGRTHEACSLKTNPGFGMVYLMDAIGLLLDDKADAVTVACDHFFSAQLAYQRLPATCSYVGYACTSYEDFLRGRCGQCANVQQCYSFDLEYQRPNPSLAHYRDQVSSHSSYFNSFSNATESGQALGSVPIDKRRVFHLRSAYKPPYCSLLFRVRVHLSDALDMSAFKTSQLSLRFAGQSGRILNVTSANDDKLVTSIDLFGPWPSADQSNPAFGLASRTLTALFDLDSEFGANIYSFGADGSPIKQVVATYDLGFHFSSSPTPINPISRIDIDYLSAPNEEVRRRLSSSFDQNQFTVVYKYFGKRAD